MVFWLAAVTGMALVASCRTSPHALIDILAAAGIMQITFSARVFVAHGGGRVTTLGLANFSLALFVGYAAVVNSRAPEFDAPLSWLTVATLGSFATQIMVTLLAWRRTQAATSPRPLPHRAAGRLRIVSAATLAACVAADQVAPPQGQLSVLLDGIAFAAVVSFSIGVLFRDQARPASLGTALIGLGFVTYVAVIHGGGSGRLRMVALACALALLISTRWPSRAWKWATVVATPAAVYWLAQERLNYQEMLSVGGSAGHSGLESMTSPIAVFARLLGAQHAGFPLAWGENFLSPLFILVPHAARPHWAPGALGYELVRVVAPDRHGSGYSVSATVFGEWVFNFGLLGLVLSVPVLVWLLRLIDHRYASALRGLARGSVVPLLFWTLLAGSIGDLCWSGTHTLIARTLARLPMLVLVALAVGVEPTRRSPSEPSTRESPRLVAPSRQ